MSSPPSESSWSLLQSTSSVLIRGSYHHESSSATSVESRIDSHDRWRIGGPGPLPEWPVIEKFDPLVISHSLYKAVVDIAIKHLQQHALNYEKIHISQRFTDGAAFSAKDVTLVIRTDLSEKSSEFISVLDSLIPIFHGLGFPGRIEMIDKRAVLGPVIFPPKLPSQQEKHWPVIRQDIIKCLEMLLLLFILRLAPGPFGPSMYFPLYT
jgi:hypothetical protein